MVMQEDDEQRLYEEVERMGVNVDDVRSANLTKEKLPHLNELERNLMENLRNRRASARRIVPAE